MPCLYDMFRIKKRRCFFTQYEFKLWSSSAIGYSGCCKFTKIQEKSMKSYYIWGHNFWLMKPLNTGECSDELPSRACWDFLYYLLDIHFWPETGCWTAQTFLLLQCSCSYINCIKSQFKTTEASAWRTHGEVGQHSQVCLARGLEGTRCSRQCHWEGWSILGSFDKSCVRGIFFHQWESIKYASRTKTP